MDDTQTVEQRITARHAQLDRYRLAYFEVYGRQPPDTLEAGDPILRELRGEDPTPGARRWPA